MKKFDYLVEDYYSNSPVEIQRKLVKYGIEGWELIGLKPCSYNNTASYFYIFKKEIAEDNKPSI